MKRSEINGLVREADDFIRSFGFRLPPFADWTPADWRQNRAKADGIVEAGGPVETREQKPKAQ